MASPSCDRDDIDSNGKLARDAGGISGVWALVLAAAVFGQGSAVRQSKRQNDTGTKALSGHTQATLIAAANEIACDKLCYGNRM